MRNNYLSFLDYLEIRRRVDSRLSKPSALFFHTVLFVCVALVAIAYTAYSLSGRGIYFIEPAYGGFMAIWSVALSIHALRVYTRSGAWGEARGRAIESEMRQFLEDSDTDPTRSESDLFRTHALLEKDIRRHSGIFSMLTLFTLILAVMWVVWAIGEGADTSFAWQMTPILGLLFLPIVGLGAWARSHRDRWLMKQLPDLDETMETSKRKHDDDDHEVAVYLTDDGELINAPDDAFVDEAKRKRVANH